MGIKKNYQATNLEKEIWSPRFLLKNVKGKDLGFVKCIPNELCDYKFQVFEVLVAETLNFMDDKMRWEVTAVSSDGGVDFKGESESKEIPGLLKFPAQIVIGQVKRRRSRIRKEELTPDLVKMFDYFFRDRETKNVLAILFIVSTSDFESSRKGIISVFENSRAWSSLYVAPKIIIDAQNFVKFWALRKHKILSILAHIFDDEELEIFDTYLHSLFPKISELINAEVRGNRVALSGRFLSMQLVISSEVQLPVIRLMLKWEPHKNERNKIELVHPINLAREKGLEIAFSGKEQKVIDLSFRCYAKGNTHLGSIHILDEDNRILSDFDLGTATFPSKFDPPYLRRPNENFHRTADELIKQARNGGISVLAAIGVGGSGKSRFCEEILDYADSLDFYCVAISHSLNKVARRQMIRELIFKLSKNNKEKYSFIDDTIEELKSHLQDFNLEYEESLKTYFNSESDTTNISHIAKCLFALLVMKTEREPVAIHLHDLHWGDREEFFILEQLIINLQFNKKHLNHGIFFVCEGRNKEALEIDEAYHSPLDWFDFLRNDFIRKVEIKHWNSYESRSFLDILFEERIDKNLYLAPQETLLHEDLVEHLLRWANGNPMYLIEQIKLLIDMGVVRQNEENGLLYVANKLPDNYEAPAKIGDLMKQRIAFFRDRFPLHIDLLIFLSKIRKKVPGSFFNFLVETISLNSLVPLREMAFCSIPRDDGYFEFYHENYFQAFFNEGLIHKDLLPIVALEWYSRLGSFTLDQILDQVKINFLLNKPKYDLIVSKLITPALRESKTKFRTQFTEAFLRNLLKVPENVLSEQGYKPYKIWVEMAECLIYVGNWEEASSYLNRIEQYQLYNQVDQEFLLVLIHSKKQLANVLTDLQRPDLAMKEIDETLAVVKKVYDSTQTVKIRLELWARKGTIYWFNGQIEEGIIWHMKALKLSAKSKDLSTKTFVLREQGTLTFHKDIKEGIKLLQAACSLGKKSKTLDSQEANLTKIQLLMGQLLQASSFNGGRERKKIQKIRDMTLSLYDSCMNESVSVYNSSLCSLVTGSSEALLGNYEESAYWFKQAVINSTHGRLYDILWKARLNLSQICSRSNGESSKIEARMHATEALNWIRDALDKLNSPYRQIRRSLMQLPLLHILRINPSSFDVINPYLNKATLKFLGEWNESPSIISWRLRPEQVMHITDKENDYFLMN